MNDQMTETLSPEAAEASAKEATLKRRALRKKLFVGFLSTVAAAGIGWTGWWYVVGSHYVETDDAYVDASLSQITPRVAGTVETVPVHETQFVKAGDLLVAIDPSDAKLALATAEANAASAERRIRQLFATVASFEAQVTARKADLARAKVDFDRRAALVKSGAVSGEEMTAAKNALATATSAVEAAQQQLDAQRALIAGTDVAHNPEVLAARALRDKAKLDLERTTLRAPIDGVVARVSAQPGQHVAVGAPLMQIVPIGKVYVNANFKESQLKKVRPGQDVELVSDLYGKDVVYHGKVAGLGGGTGSAFALIPAQNATGNWIKVVQRLPVRVTLDTKELAEHPLRVGLSMTAEIRLDD